MKTIWKGSLNFGLVTISIELYSAIQEHVVSFKLLHDTCKTPIHNLHWCPHCKKALTWDHIVKGLPLDKNKFFIITKQALRELKPFKSSTIALTTFIDESELDPLWTNQHYYALPQKTDDRAYALFVTALETEKKIALGTIIMKDKEHICVFRPYHNRLLMTTLHYAYELRPLPPAQKSIRFTFEELEVAHYLIKKLSKKTLSLEQFKDTFIEQLKKAVTQKLKPGKKITVKKIKPSEKKETLLETLQKSVSLASSRHRK